MLATPTRPHRRPGEYRDDGASSAVWQVTLVTLLITALSLIVIFSAAAIELLT